MSIKRTARASLHILVLTTHIQADYCRAYECTIMIGSHRSTTRLLLERAVLSRYPPDLELPLASFTGIQVKTWSKLKRKKCIFADCGSLRRWYPALMTRKGLHPKGSVESFTTTQIEMSMKDAPGADLFSQQGQVVRDKEITELLGRLSSVAKLKLLVATELRNPESVPVKETKLQGAGESFFEVIDMRFNVAITCFKHDFYFYFIEIAITDITNLGLTEEAIHVSFVTWYLSEKITNMLTEEVCRHPSLTEQVATRPFERRQIKYGWMWNKNCRSQGTGKRIIKDFHRLFHKANQAYWLSNVKILEGKSSLEEGEEVGEEMSFDILLSIEGWYGTFLFCENCGLWFRLVRMQRRTNGKESPEKKVWKWCKQLETDYPRRIISNL